LKTLTIANQKGGVGKSTLAVHLVWYAAELGYRVLLVDLDGQANSTRTFAETPKGLSASSLFRRAPDGSLPEPVSHAVSLIHADVGINDVEGLPLETIKTPAAWLRQYRKDYEFCVIDTPPNLGRRLLAALIAGDYVVSPVGLNGYSIQGITDLQRTILTVKKNINPHLTNLGILPNLVNHRSKTQQTLLAGLRERLGDRMLPFALTNRVAVSDAIDNRHPVWRKGRGESSQKAGEEMRQVCGEIVRRIFK
jgi:chromosome partitioning protein